MEMSAPRRSQLLQALLQQQVAPRQIVNPVQLAAELGSQAMRQRQMQNLRGQEQKERDTLAKAMSGQIDVAGPRDPIVFEGVPGLFEEFGPTNPDGSPRDVSRKGVVLSPENQSLITAHRADLATLRKAEREAAGPTAHESAMQIENRRQEGETGRTEMQIGAERYQFDKQITENRDQFAKRYNLDVKQLDQEFQQRQTQIESQNEQFWVNLDAEERQQERQHEHEVFLLDKEIEADLKLQREKAKTVGKEFSQSQWEAATFAVRIEQAQHTLNQHETYRASGGPSLTNPLGRGGAYQAVMPVARGAINKQVDQAERNFVNAVLRRESGAAISESEFANAEKQYFPTWKDDEATIAQKRQNRETVLAGLTGEGGGAYTQLGSMVQNRSQGMNFNNTASDEESGWLVEELPDND